MARFGRSFPIPHRSAAVFKSSLHAATALLSASFNATAVGRVQVPATGLLSASFNATATGSLNPAFIQGTAVNVTTTSGTLSPALTGIGAGHALVLSITNTSVATGQAASAVTGGGAARWIYAGSVDAAIGVSDIWVGADNAGSSGSQTVTVTLNGVAAVAGCELDEFSNIDLTNPLQSFSSSSGTSATITSPTQTPAETSDVVYLFSTATSTETASPSSPWATETGPTTAGAQRNGVAYYLSTTGGTGYSTSWTQTLGAYTVAGVVLNAIDVPIGSDAALGASFNATATGIVGVSGTGLLSVSFNATATGLFNTPGTATATATFNAIAVGTITYYATAILAVSFGASAGGSTPAPPSNVYAVATVNGANVMWGPPASGSPSSYTVVPYQGDIAGTPVTVPANVFGLIFTGLFDGVPYDFEVIANA